MNTLNLQFSGYVKKLTKHGWPLFHHNQLKINIAKDQPLLCIQWVTQNLKKENKRFSPSLKFFLGQMILEFFFFLLFSLSLQGGRNK